MTLYLGNGDNTYSAPLGDVSVDAQGGTDRLVINYSSAGGPIVYGWNYYSDEALNTIDFYNFESYDITGGADSDDLRGGDNADRLLGGGGNDTLYGGLGADVIDGGAGGKDRWVVDYNPMAPADVAVSLLANGATFTVGVSGAKVKNVEALTIDTGLGNDVIDTSAVTGNDDIETRDGDDLVTPGLGFDRVELGGGNDTLVLNYATRTADILHQDKGYGWFQYQDGLAPTASVYYYLYNIEQFNLGGGSGNDNLSGRWDHDGNDRLVGNAGNDILYGYGGVDTINGGAGTDTWVFNYDEVNANVAIDISGATQSASTGATLSGIEQLVADTHLGDDVIIAKPGAFNDNIETRGGADSITPGRGVDTINAGSYGEDNLLVLDWSMLTTTVAWSDAGYGWYRFSSGEGDRVDLYAIDRYDIRAGSGNDTLRTSGGNDTLAGGDGNDWLASGSGRATVDGGLGTDYWEADLSAILGGLMFNAAAGQATAQGAGAGHAILRVEGLRLTTGAGNDTLDNQGYATDDVVTTNDGNDAVSLGLGFDQANGGNGTDTLTIDYSTLGSAISRTDPGYGWYSYGDILGTASISFYSFEKFNLTGGSDGDNLYGAGSDDRLVGNGGNDVLSGYGGKDTIDGGEGNDGWVGDWSSSTGAISLNLPNSGSGSLKVNGVAQTSLASIENVTLTTGLGSDVINLLGRPGMHTVNTGDGNDTVKLGSGTHTSNGGYGNDLLVLDFSTSTSAIRQIDQGYGWYLFYDTGELNSLTHSGFEQFDITGGSGNDRLWALGGDDKINGGSGNDVLTGNGGNDILSGGAGVDIFVFAGYDNGTDTLTDAASGDIIRVNGRSFSGAVTLGDGSAVLVDQVQLAVDATNNLSTLYVGSDWTAGAEVVITLEGTYDVGAFTLSGRDILLTAGSSNPGTAGDDTLNGTAGNDELSGGDGKDKLLGKGGNDVLDGGAGNDVLNGGPGADSLSGGEGADRFQYGAIGDSTPGTLYHDAIADFVAGSDKIDLSAIDANPVVSGNQAFKFVTGEFTGAAGQVRYDAAADLVLADVNGDGMTDLEIALLGVQLPALGASDFIL